MNKKTIVITGGTGGIGTAMAATMAKKGHIIVVSYLRETEKENAEKMLRQIKAETECDGMAVQADVSNYDDCERLVAQTMEHYGQIDVMVNNAGVFMKSVKYHEIDIKQINTTLNINLKGVMYGTRAVLPHMIKAGAGCIVNTASIAGLQSSPGYADYSASKAGVIGFTRSIAGEYAAHKIRCNAIAPGIIDTTMIDHMRQSESLSHIPLGRLGTPQDIADCLDYIVHADYLTGQTISPNGGVIMR